MTIKATHCLGIFCLSVVSMVSADTSLPILRTLPRCEYSVVQQFQVTDQIYTVTIRQELDRQHLLADLIKTVRIKSEDVSADAIILQKIDTDQFRTGGIVNGNLDHYRLRIKVQADAIKLCEEDQTTPLRSTPYNERGERNAKIPDETTNVSTEIKISLSDHTASKTTLLKLDPSISLQHGFHQVKPGMTTEEVATLWGEADAEFQLQRQGYTALAYGNRYWLTLYQGNVVAIETEHPILSADVSHQIPDNPLFSKLNWALDGNFASRTPLKELHIVYPGLQLIQENVFSLKDDQTEMQLSFHNYRGIHSDNSEPMLSKVQMKSVLLGIDQQSELKAALKEIQQTKSNNTPFAQQFWSNLLQPLPKYNTIKLRNGETMSILNSSIAAVFRRQQLVEVQLLPVYKNQDAELVQNTLKTFNIPNSKAAFLTLFPDAYDSIGKLTYYGEQMEVSALYSQNEGHLIDSVVIRFM